MVETEIDASNTWFLQKLADGETAAAATAYEKHAVLLPPVGGAITGRKAIEIFWQSGIEIGVQAVELEPLERRQAARVVCEIGRYRFVLQRAEDQPTLEQGTYFAFHRHGPDGSWLRLVDSFNREPSPTSASAWVTRR